jgi:mono/diheme cytochrome c family protein
MNKRLTCMPTDRSPRFRHRSTLLQLISLSIFAVGMLVRPMPASAALRRLAANDKLIASGKKVFNKNCMSCHGVGGKGGDGPKLMGLTMSDARLTKMIKNGKAGEMPAFGGKLSASQLKSLKAYIRTLK